MRRAAALVLAAVFAAAAFGEDWVPVKDEVAKALQKGDRAAALAVLERFTKPLPNPELSDVRGRQIEAANAALDLVGGPDGDLVAARILVATLRMDRSDRGGAYTLAMRLRKRAVRREADTKTAQELFLGLTSVYPDTVEFQYDLALAYRDAGRPDDARRVYAGIATSVPAEARARHELAVLEEDRGALGNALALYDASIRLRENEPKPDLAAHLSKTSLLLWKAHDLAAAKDAFAKGVAAVAAAAPGPERDDYASRFDAMKTDLAVVETRHARLRDVRRHLDAVLWGVAAAWAAVLGGGVAWLRRAKWL